MKKATGIFFLFILSYPAFAGSNTCSKANILIKLFDKYHFQPIAINEKVSGEIFDDFIKQLDPKGLYFTTADMTAFAPFRTRILSQVNAGSCTFLETVSKLYKQRLIFADTLVSLLCAQPFTYTSNDKINVDTYESESLVLPANIDELKMKWFLMLRYEVLEALVQPTAELPDILSKDNKIILKNEAALRSKYKSIEKRKISRIKDSPKGFDNYVGDIFLNTIAQRYDPHSMYLNQDKKEDFMANFSVDEMTYGFFTDENKNGELEITFISPGGSAWKSNLINMGDVLLKVKFENKSPINLAGIDENEFEEILSSNSNARVVEVTFRKANSLVKTVTLQKEKTESDDNIVKSYILSGAKKIGYIYLPSFYSDWDKKNPLGCGNDVTKEIIKLQSEKIEGLILDLRFNGGGSFHEAINLAGIFIDEGPLCVVKIKNEKPHVFKDMNRSTAYDGPLVVMVNGCSASASELLSAVLQDYHRAVIVGNATYGKATAQATFPMDINYDPHFPTANASADLGYVNITTGKFYRVTQLSHQNQGVQPDIFLPDLFFFSEQKESKEKYALAADTVGKNIYYTALPNLPLSALQKNSKSRVNANIGFKTLSALNDSIKLLNEKIVPLNLDAYKRAEKRANNIIAAVDTLYSTPFKSYTAGNNVYDKKVFNVNDFSKQMNDHWLKKIQSDIYIEESYNIISDLINFKK